MVRIKPEIDGRGASVGFYDGPPPKPGTYVGVVKKMALNKIARGDNEGKPRIALLLEITEGQFKGAGIMHSLNETEQGKGFLNQFLHAMTDGSDKQKKMIEEWYWELGYDVESESDGKMGRPFNYIGKPTFKPIGKKVAFTTKMDSYNEEPKAAIVSFIVPLEDSEESEPEEEVLAVSSDDADDSDDSDDSVVAEDSSDEGDDFDSPTSDSGGDDDNPWGDD